MGMERDGEMSERLHTWRYLCDTCKHFEKWRPNCVGKKCLITDKSGIKFRRKAINDKQEPKDVCKWWETRDGDCK